MVVSVKFDAEMSDYSSGIDQAIKDLKDWESQTGVSALNATDKFEAAIRAVVLLGDATERSVDDQVRALEGLGLSAEDAEDALDAIRREADDLGDQAPRSIAKAGDAVEKISDKTPAVGNSLRDLGSIAKDVLAGDFSAAASGALDALGGIATAAGIGGAVGGALVDAVSGLVGATVEQFTAYSDKVKEIRDDTSAALVDMGGAFDAAALNSRITDIVNDTDRWNAALLIQQQTGVDLATVLSGLAGNAEDAATTSAAFSDAWDNIPGNVDTKVLYDAKAALEGVTGALDGAPAKVDAVADAMQRNSDKTQSTNDKIRETADLLAKGFPVPADVVVPVRADLSQFERSIADAMRRSREVTIAVNSGGRQLLQ